MTIWPTVDELAYAIEMAQQRALPEPLELRLEVSPLGTWKLLTSEEAENKTDGDKEERYTVLVSVPFRALPRSHAESLAEHMIEEAQKHAKPRFFIPGYIPKWIPRSFKACPSCQADTGSSLCPECVERRWFYTQLR